MKRGLLRAAGRALRELCVFAYGHPSSMPPSPLVSGSVWRSARHVRCGSSCPRPDRACSAQVDAQGWDRGAMPQERHGAGHPGYTPVREARCGAQV